MVASNRGSVGNGIGPRHGHRTGGRRRNTDARRRQGHRRTSDLAGGKKGQTRDHGDTNEGSRGPQAVTTGGVRGG